MSEPATCDGVYHYTPTPEACGHEGKPCTLPIVEEHRSETTIHVSQGKVFFSQDHQVKCSDTVLDLIVKAAFHYGFDLHGASITTDDESYNVTCDCGNTMLTHTFKITPKERIKDSDDIHAQDGTPSSL